MYFFLLQSLARRCSGRSVNYWASKRRRLNPTTKCIRHVDYWKRTTWPLWQHTSRMYSGVAQIKCGIYWVYILLNKTESLDYWIQHIYRWGITVLLKQAHTYLKKRVDEKRKGKGTNKHWDTWNYWTIKTGNKKNYWREE